MSLTIWTILYIIDVFFAGWMFLRSGRWNSEARNNGYILVLWLVLSTGWFLTGLFVPEARLFISSQPSQ